MGLTLKRHTENPKKGAFGKQRQNAQNILSRPPPRWLAFSLFPRYWRRFTASLLRECTVSSEELKRKMRRHFNDFGGSQRKVLIKTFATGSGRFCFRSTRKLRRSRCIQRNAFWTEVTRACAYFIFVALRFADAAFLIAKLLLATL